LCFDDFFGCAFVARWFFCGGFFCGGFADFSDMLWWLGGFSDVLSWLGGFFCGAAVFFSAFDGACFATIGFFCFFGGDSGLISISWLELAPPELNNGSCVDSERGDIEGREDDLGDDDGHDCGGL
jgi:hypothetical protein